MADDDAIRATNDDATACKKFAVQQGYWIDPYLQYLTKTADRKAPEINRGYFTRVQGIRMLAKQFIQKTNQKCQVINLGAGFDTNYWLLKDEGLSPSCFIDIDFPAVTTRKCYYIKNRKPLLAKIAENPAEVTITQYDLHSPDYHIVGVDLRKLDDLESKLEECFVDKELPTLVIAECVLVYMNVSHSKALLTHLATNFKSLYFINYEQVNMLDRFGQVMVENLRRRDCQLRGIEYCGSMEQQRQRFLESGWEAAECWDMNTIYARLPAAQVQRIERLEMMDEVELLQQLFHHYCITVAYKDPNTIGLAEISL